MARIGTVVRCIQSDILLHVKRLMLQFVQTHKFVLFYNNSSFQNGLHVFGGWVYVHFRVGDVTNP